MSVSVVTVVVKNVNKLEINTFFPTLLWAEPSCFPILIKFFNSTHLDDSGQKHFSTRDKLWYFWQRVTAHKLSHLSAGQFWSRLTARRINPVKTVTGNRKVPEEHCYVCPPGYLSGSGQLQMWATFLGWNYLVLKIWARPKDVWLRVLLSC